MEQEGRSSAQQVPDGVDPPPLTIVLSPRASLEGLVTSRGVPIEKALVVAFQKSASNGRIVATSQADGRYRFDQLPPGDWQIQASLRASPTAQILQVVSTTIEAGQSAHLDIEVTRGSATLTTKILEVDGSLLANARVYLSTGNIVASTAAQIESALAARGPGQTRVDLLIQGQPVRFADLTPGPWSLCAIFVRGNLNDPVVVQRIQSAPGSLPASCTPVDVSSGSQSASLQAMKN